MLRRCRPATCAIGLLLPLLPPALACPALLCRVYLCARVWENPLTGEVLDISTSGASSSSGSGSGVVKAANLVKLHADGCATLADGTRLPGLDAVMYCTGYDYSFPFLQQAEDSGGSGGSSGGFVSVQDSRVGPLYHHIFPPAAAPTLSFVGLPWKVVPFPQFELQARWIARVLAGASQLPPQEVRRARAARAAGAPA